MSRDSRSPTVGAVLALPIAGEAQESLTFRKAGVQIRTWGQRAQTRRQRRQLIRHRVGVTAGIRSRAGAGAEAGDAMVLIGMVSAGRLYRAGDRGARMLLVLASLLSLTPGAVAAPPNDNFADATEMVGLPAEATGSIVDATVSQMSRSPVLSVRFGSSGRRRRTAGSRSHWRVRTTLPSLGSVGPHVPRVYEVRYLGWWCFSRRSMRRPGRSIGSRWRRAESAGGSGYLREASARTRQR